MNVTVFNLDSLSVTEYDLALTGISGDYESSSAGVQRVVDAPTEDVRGVVTFGLAFGDGETRRQRPKYLYVFGEGNDKTEAVIETTQGPRYRYAPQMRHDRTTRFVLGAGIRDNYLKLSLNLRGTRRTSIDRLDFETVASTTRRL